jgi:hypothetical protein
LDAGQSQSFTFDSAYPDPGDFDVVAIVDVSEVVDESNEANNSRTLRVTVRPAPPRQARVTVNFTQINVHNDTDRFFEGELWLDFNISGQTGRWPTSGTQDVKSGDTYTINKRFEVTLTESEKLVMSVKGAEEDNPLLGDPHDDMGTVRREFAGADEWGKGSHFDRSTCPEGCYTIYYTIDVTWLQ